MATFAIIENGTVINVIVADSKEIAEQVTEKECFEYTEDNPIVVGASWDPNYEKYINPSPFPSWIYNGVEWEAPVRLPEEDGKLFFWNEDTLSWRSVPLEISEG
jgi:hypothetical protein